MGEKAIYFSPTGGVKTVAEILCNDLIDFTLSGKELNFKSEDVCYILAPVYYGRVPQVFIERLSEIKGNGAKAVVVSVYGNREFDDALLELKNTSEKIGFKVVAGIGAIAQHSIANTIGEGRPNKSDIEQLNIFKEKINKKIESGKIGVEVVGNYPYKEIGTMPDYPRANKNCTKCGVCVENCPVGAIISLEETDKEKCIGCMRCVAVCPENARKLNRVIVNAVTEKLKMVCSEPKENTLYI